MSGPLTRLLTRASNHRRSWFLSGGLPLLLRWLLLLGWMGLIFMFSADSDSGATSGGILQALVGLFSGVLGPIAPETREWLHLLLRKAAHFTEYAVLALLWTGVLKPGPRRWLWAFLLTTGYAATDEIHQIFVPNRGPSPIDVLIDASGAATALAAFRLFTHRQLDRLTKIH